MNLSQKYTNAYVTNGKCIVSDRDVEDQFLNKIVECLPGDYLGVDIGACDGEFGEKIMRKKAGKILSIDPYPVSGSVISAKGEDFLKDKTAAYDCIILKYSIHFFSNMDAFYESCRQALKPTGTIFILSLSPKSLFPWSPELNDTFLESCRNCEYTFQRASVEKRDLSSHMTLSKDEFSSFLIERSFSNLFSNSDEEIQQCIQQLNEVNSISLFVQMIVVSRME